MQKKALTLFPLIMLIAGAIDSIRNLPATALFGPSLIFFCIAAALLFLIPTGLISAELSAKFPKEGGIYNWTRRAFGEKWAVLAIWLQWINTMVWYPTILAFIAGTLAYLVDPHLADNKLYLITTTLITFWLLTIINCFGLKVSAQFVKICTLIGMVLPMAFIIILGALWLCLHLPRQIHFSFHSIFPSPHNLNGWTSLTAIIAAYLGMELATVHITHVKHPRKTFPRALMISVVIILTTMTLGALSIAIVIPHGEINLVDGTLQAFGHFLHAYHLQFLTPILTCMILLGAIGSMVNWVISPAKGLMQAAIDGYLPQLFARSNAHGVATSVLFLQAIIVTLICFSYLLMPSVNGTYWLLTDLSTQLYLFMYIILFSAGIYISFRYAKTPSTFSLPGKKIGTTVVGLVGMMGSFISIMVGFIPPQEINTGSHIHYEMVFGGGLILMCLPVSLLFLYHHYYGKPNVKAMIP